MTVSKLNRMMHAQMRPTMVKIKGRMRRMRWAGDDVDEGGILLLLSDITK